MQRRLLAVMTEMPFLYAVDHLLEDLFHIVTNVINAFMMRLRFFYIDR